MKRLYKFSLCLSLVFFISLAKIANFTNYLLSNENIYLMFAVAINLYLPIIRNSYKPFSSFFKANIVCCISTFWY